MSHSVLLVQSTDDAIARTCIKDPRVAGAHIIGAEQFFDVLSVGGENKACLRSTFCWN